MTGSFAEVRSNPITRKLFPSPALSESSGGLRGCLHDAPDHRAVGERVVVVNRSHSPKRRLAEARLRISEDIGGSAKIDAAALAASVGFAEFREHDARHR